MVYSGKTNFVKKCEHLKKKKKGKKEAFSQDHIKCQEVLPSRFSGGNRALLTVQMFSHVSNKQLLGVPARTEPFRQNVSSCQSCVNILNSLATISTGVKCSFPPTKGQPTTLFEALPPFYSPSGEIAS